MVKDAYTQFNINNIEKARVTTTGMTVTGTATATAFS